MFLSKMLMTDGSNAKRITDGYQGVNFTNIAIAGALLCLINIEISSALCPNAGISGMVDPECLNTTVTTTPAAGGNGDGGDTATRGSLLIYGLPASKFDDAKGQDGGGSTTENGTTAEDGQGPIKRPATRKPRSGRSNQPTMTMIIGIIIVVTFSVVGGSIWMVRTFCLVRRGHGHGQGDGHGHGECPARWANFECLKLSFCR